MGDGYDPVQFGRLIQGVENMSQSVKTLTTKVEGIEEKMNKGRGFLAGLSLGAAALGGGVGAMAHKFLEQIK